MTSIFLRGSWSVRKLKEREISREMLTRKIKFLGEEKMEGNGETRRVCKIKVRRVGIGTIEGCEYKRMSGMA